MHGVPFLPFLTPHALSEMHCFAAVVTEELECPISSTERAKHVELNKDTCTLCTLHAEAMGFSPQKKHTVDHLMH